MPEISCENESLETLQNGQWNQLVLSLPDAHVLQSAQWGQIKANYGWDLHPLTWRDEQGQLVAAALVMSRKLSLPGIFRKINFLYIPKGPLLNWQDRLLRQRILKDIAAFARQVNSIFIKIDPDISLGSNNQAGEISSPDFGSDMMTELRLLGWQFSNQQVQFRNTIHIDLNREAGDLLSAMKQKTRYNIRLAERKGVEIRKGSTSDIPLLYRMYLETSLRDKFLIREEGYYRDVWSTFIKCDLAEVLIAEVDNQPVAGLILYRFAGKAWFLYGMSGAEHRQKMPNYLLQWEAILHLKESGCQVYDLWGAPDDLVETDPLWGVYKFKEGLGGVLVRHIGAWDFPVRKTFYSIYTKLLPAVLDWMRWRGRIRLRNLSV